VFGVTVQLEKRTTEKLRALRPPSALESEHRRAVALWTRRISLLSYYYGRLPELDDPDFRREFGAAIKRIDRLSASLQRRFTALGVTPECDLFV
jgi:hypothetical protein